MTNNLKICFATMTGNAETLADETHERARAEGWACERLNLIEVQPGDLATMKLAVFIVSTWGDGDPPDDAEEFWQGLEDGDYDLSGLTYAVFGLGDKDYSEFNGFARKLDTRLSALGAQPLTSRAEADLDFDDTFNTWLEHIVPLISKRPEIATA